MVRFLSPTPGWRGSIRGLQLVSVSSAENRIPPARCAASTTFARALGREFWSGASAPCRSLGVPSFGVRAGILSRLPAPRRESWGGRGLRPLGTFLGRSPPLLFLARVNPDPTSAEIILWFELSREQPCSNDCEECKHHNHTCDQSQMHE